MIIKNVTASFDEVAGKVRFVVTTDGVSCKTGIDVRECEDIEGLLTVICEQLIMLRMKVKQRIDNAGGKRNDG